jgi:hypothetical protein
MQPLGLRFISASSSSIVFGNPDPTFEVKASPGTPRPTRIVLSVGTPSAVSAFHAAAKRANSKGTCQLQLQENNGSGGGSRASVTDLEGNILEVSSTGSKVTRILSWNAAPATSAVGIAQSTASSAASSRPGLATLVPSADESYRVIRRSFTTSTFESAPPQQESSKGLSTGAMIGTVLGAVAAGVAVGAGLSYAFSKKEQVPRQQYDAPPFERRSSCPDPDQQPRYIEMERTVEKVKYPEQYPPGSHRFSQPAYTTRRLEASTPVVEEVDDYFSPHHSDSRTGDHSAGPREPLLLTEAEHKSEVGSRHPEPPRSDPRKIGSERLQSPHSDRRSNVELQRPESPYVDPESNSDSQRPPSPPAPPRAEPKSKASSQPPTPPPIPPHLGPRGSVSSRPLESSHRPVGSRRASEAPSTDAKWRLHAELLKRTKSKDSSKASSQASDARSQVSSRGKHDDRHNRVSSRSKRDDDGRSSQVSLRSKHDGDDRHRHRSSRHKDDDDDSRSHVSSRSKHDEDRRRHKSSRSKSSRDVDEETFVSARNDRTANTVRSSNHRDRTPTRKSHRASAREMPTPPEDNDGEGISPDDSISCVGERPKPHARDLPFLHSRERIMIG